MKQKTKPGEKNLDFRIDDDFEEKRLRGRIIRARVIGVILLLMLFFYIPSFFYWIFSANIGTDTIKMGSLEDSIELDGYLVRNEIVLNANQTGRFFSEINEGERVQAFSKIASVVSDDKENLFEDLAKVNQRLIEYYREMSRNKQIFSFEVSRIDEEIGKKVNNIIGIENDGDISQISDIKTDIEGLSQKRVQVVSDISTNDTNFSKLKESRKAIVSDIKANTIDIKSEVAGMVSYMLDGKESELNSKRLGEIKPSELLAIKNNSTFVQSNDSRVLSGNPFAKVILDNEYYIVFVMKKEQAETFEISHEVKLRINELDRTMRGIVEYKSAEIEDNYIVAIKVDRGLSELTGQRKIRLNIVKNSFSGFKVPLLALQEMDVTNKKAKLMVLKGGVSKLIDVKIIGNNDEFAIIDNLKVSYSSGINLYDVFIMNTKVKEGQFLN